MQEKTWDFTAASTVTLISAVLVLFTFIFLPWYGDSLTENGARLLSDNLYGTPGAKIAPMLWLVPLASLGGIALGLLGLLKSEHNRIAAIGALAFGIVGLFYYLFNVGSPLLADPQYQPGLGFWIAFMGLVGLVIQFALAIPAVSRALSRSTGKVAWRGPRIPRHAIPWLFLAAPLTLYFAWIILPTFYTMFLSLTNWDGISTPKIIGLTNFERLFTKDRNFVESLINNLKWLLVFITVPTTLGLSLAIVFNSEMRGSRVFKVSFYATLVLSLAVIGLIWAWAYNPQMGLINSFLREIGVRDPPGWLG